MFELSFQSVSNLSSFEINMQSISQELQFQLFSLNFLEKGHLHQFHEKSNFELGFFSKSSFFNFSGNGFEAFVTSGGTLVVAVAYKKEFLAVPLEDGPIDDELWHCIDICHSAAKRRKYSCLFKLTQI